MKRLLTLLRSTWAMLLAFACQTETATTATAVGACAAGAKVVVTIGASTVATGCYHGAPTGGSTSTGGTPGASGNAATGGVPSMGGNGPSNGGTTAAPSTDKCVVLCAAEAALGCPAGSNQSQCVAICHTNTSDGRFTQKDIDCIINSKTKVQAQSCSFVACR